MLKVGLFLTVIVIVIFTAVSILIDNGYEIKEARKLIRDITVDCPGLPVRSYKMVGYLKHYATYYSFRTKDEKIQLVSSNCFVSYDYSH